MHDARESRIKRTIKHERKLERTLDAIQQVEYVARWADAEYEAVLRDTARRLRYTGEEDDSDD